MRAGLPATREGAAVSASRGAGTGGCAAVCGGILRVEPVSAQGEAVLGTAVPRSDPGVFLTNAPSRSVLSLILKVEPGALSCGFCASRLIAGTAEGRTASEPAAFLFGGAVRKDAF